jgi:hypothetical protein
MSQQEIVLEQELDDLIKTLELEDLDKSDKKKYTDDGSFALINNLFCQYKEGILKLNKKEQQMFDAIMNGRTDHWENIKDALYIVKYCTDYKNLEEELKWWTLSSPKLAGVLKAVCMSEYAMEE